MVEEEAELRVQVGADPLLRFLRQRPQRPLERSERLLARLVQELLVGLIGLALIGAWTRS